MKKKILIIIIALLLIIAAVVLILKSFCGWEDKITLITNGGVPYNWEYTIEDSEVATFDRMDSKAKNELAGGEIENTYYFAGLKEGTTTIIFEYKNITDGSIDKTKKFKVKVDKDLKVKVKETK